MLHRTHQTLAPVKAMLDLVFSDGRTEQRRQNSFMRMKHLDTLRAFAIGLVMVEHFGGKALNDHIPIGAGSVGVGLFFTLSGFLITGILMQNFDTADNKAVAWRDFY